jgi:PIN domain nuclease of toxin-antitoxin system
LSRYLLDTNALLLLMLEASSVSVARREAIAQGDRLVSHISGVEIAIKHSIGKLDLPSPFQVGFAHAFGEVVSSLSAVLLPLELTHIEALSHLPLHHRDPFDRLIIAQALVENLTIVTRDRSFALYPGLDVYEI